MPDVRVILADDHPVVRSGLVALLASKDGIAVVAEAGDGQECVEAVARLDPDVVLMDLRMPRLDGAAATAAITSAHPATKVVVLTTYDEDADIVRAVEAGAVGYLLKDSGADQIARAVRDAARGETVLAPRMATTLMNHLRAPSGPPLSPREIEVLGGVGEGLSNAEIGRRLHITEATVKTHLVRAFAKLGTQDRTRAVLEAMRAGYLPGP
ncbi:MULTISPECIES: response regulator [Brevibacterium]|uniref:DNA-binding response regulator n=1 Tax=Brevibacterium casei TaxID=33889 RepID=A0A269ZHS4_9MICO|nr:MULTISPECIES: response regulator transcription factor [Brevibacterium]MCM1013153.1 response regulator transcription factor [Brevibacterium sp. XM4083]PAK97348.1 DNA-binding response regulator [Brevibacterium casei]QPS34582.1 response regulator transcription factor [Brevibacterium casei]